MSRVVTRALPCRAPSLSADAFGARSSPKKQLFEASGQPNGGGRDRLSALDAIMRDARGLVAR